jgi:class 3 adenylate cyclase
MRDLDPEEARAIVDPVLQLMMAAVHRYGGYVAQSTGDGIFALFGAPVAHEDHPQCALYAALPRCPSRTMSLANEKTGEFGCSPTDLDSSPRAHSTTLVCAALPLS